MEKGSKREHEILIESNRVRCRSAAKWFGDELVVRRWRGTQVVNFDAAVVCIVASVPSPKTTAWLPPVSKKHIDRIDKRVVAERSEIVVLKDRSRPWLSL